MLVKSTSCTSPSAARMWAAVAVGATCLAANPANADYQGQLKIHSEPLRGPIGSTARWPANGDVFHFTVDGLGTEQSLTARETSEQEHIIGTLRSWEGFGANWDHEGAKAPNMISLRAASSFVCSLDRKLSMPEPMLHDTGRAGLFWETEQLYADLEFLEDGSIAYYIERGKDRHKGVVAFDKRNIPDFLEPLLKA